MGKMLTCTINGEEDGGGGGGETMGTRGVRDDGNVRGGGLTG